MVEQFQSTAPLSPFFSAKFSSRLTPATATTGIKLHFRFFFFHRGARRREIASSADYIQGLRLSLHLIFGFFLDYETSRERFMLRVAVFALDSLHCSCFQLRLCFSLRKLSRRSAFYFLLTYSTAVFFSACIWLIWRGVSSVFVLTSKC